MAKCTKCGAVIKSGGYDTEELNLPNATCYLVSCKQCKTLLGIVQEQPNLLLPLISSKKERDGVEPKQRMLNDSINIEIMVMHGLI